MADGRKLEPFVLFKGVCPVAALEKIPCVAYGRSGSMNEKMTKDRGDGVWKTRNSRRRLCGMVENITLHTDTDVSVIPGGLIQLVQPANVSWNQHF